MYRNHSDSNGFSAASENSTVRVNAIGILGATRCSIVVQAGAAFTRSLLDALQRSVQKGGSSISIHAVASRSDDETIELIRTLGRQSDAFALLGKNTERVKATLLDLRALGIPVMALVSDLDANARSTYIGADNRAAGQLAGFIFGRCLERESDTKVALVACNLSYRCWEDCEIGFRALLRRRFPQIEIVEVVTKISIVNVARRFLIGLRTGAARCGEVNLVPIELVSKFNLQSRTAL